MNKIAVLFGFFLVFLSLDASSINSSDIPYQMSNRGEKDLPYQFETESAPYITDFPVIDSLYIVGPGDIFKIFLESMIIDAQVNAEGNIILPKIGIIALDGLTLKQAKKAILELVQTATIKSQCFVNLGRPKIMRVFISGAVVLPGVYDIHGNARLSYLLQIAGGFRENAKKDEVIIVHKNGEKKSFNIDNFFLRGNLSSNPYLAQGASVIVPFVDYEQPFVIVRSESLNTDVQLQAGETVWDIIQKFTSYQKIPAPIAVHVCEKNGSGKILTGKDITIYKPSSEACITFSAGRNSVFVGGEVERPGFVPYNSEYRVAQYLFAAGLKPTSNLPQKITVRGGDGEIRRVSVKDDVLRPGDMIVLSGNIKGAIITYSPIFLSFTSLAIAIATIFYSSK